ncbi:pilus assembly protein PilL, partial [Escherichia coli]
MKTSLLLSVLSACVLLTGCQGQQKLLQRDAAVPVPSVTVSNNVRPASPDMYAGTTVPEVVRYDRYLLVNTHPDAVQRDPLSQVIDIRIPASLKPTVADAMRYALKQSGYTLCATG